LDEVREGRERRGVVLLMWRGYGKYKLYERHEKVGEQFSVWSHFYRIFIIAYQFISLPYHTMKFNRV
jgi:hypothetical protein